MENRYILPSYYNQYGFGSWLKSNVGNLAQTIGGAALTFLVPGGQAAGIGMMSSGVGGMAGSAISGEHKDRDQEPQLSTADIMASRKGEYMTYATGGPIIPKLYRPSADPTRLAETLPTTISNLALTNYRPSVSTKELGFGDSTVAKLDPSIDYTDMVRKYKSVAGYSGLPEDSSVYPAMTKSRGSQYLVEGYKMNDMVVPGVNVYNRGNQEWKAVFDNNDNLVTDPNKQNRIIQSRTRQMIRQNVGKGVARTNDQIRKAINRTGVVPSYADGGFLTNSLVTEYNQGSSHEQSPYGGIPVGGKNRVEKGEVRFDDPDTGESYIFSDRF